MHLCDATTQRCAVLHFGQQVRQEQHLPVAIRGGGHNGGGLGTVDNGLVIEVDPVRFEEMVASALDGLPEEFSTADAKAARRANALGDGNDATNKFLAECKQLPILEKLETGRWRKVAA